MLSDAQAIILLKDVKEMREAMLGNPLTGKKGFVTIVGQVNEDLYGINLSGQEIASKKNTLLTRVSKVEDNQSKIAWILTGMLGLFIAIKVGLTAVIMKIFDK
jgi:hypothetical protein